MIFQLVWIPCRWKPGFCLSKSEPSHKLTDTWGEKNIPTDLQMDGATKTGPQRWLKTMEHKIFIYDFTRQIERCQCVQPMYKCVHHNRTIIYSHWHVYIYICIHIWCACKYKVIHSCNIIESYNIIYYTQVIQLHQLTPHITNSTCSSWFSNMHSTNINILLINKNRPSTIHQHIRR